MLMALSSFAMLTAYADEAEGSAADSEQVGTAGNGGSTLALSGLGYFEYLAAHKDAAGDVTDVKVDVLNYVGSEGVKTETLTDGNGKSHEGVTLVAGGSVEWTVNVEKSGFYNIKTLYLMKEVIFTGIDILVTINSARRNYPDRRFFIFHYVNLCTRCLTS